MNEGKEKEFDFHFQTPAAHGLSFRRLICNSAGQSLSELFNRNAPTPPNNNLLRGTLTLLRESAMTVYADNSPRTESIE